VRRRERIKREWGKERREKYRSKRGKEENGKKRKPDKQKRYKGEEMVTSNNDG
jgi:hypothetical protein